MIFELHLSKLTVDQGLHNLFHLLFFSQILLVGLSFFFSLFIHLSLDHILRLIAFTLLFWLSFLHLSLLPFFLLEHFSLKFCLIDLNKWEMLPANLLCVLAFTRAVWLSLYWGSLAVFCVYKRLNYIWELTLSYLWSHFMLIIARISYKLSSGKR